MEIKEGYVYHIKNDYFELVNDDKLMKNHEGNSTRPNYFCVKMEDEDILWFIPMSSRVEKYKVIVDNKIKKYKNMKITDNDIMVEVENGNYVSASQLSEGTIEQLYFSLRMAILKEISNETLPIFLDESFVFFDKNRLINTINYLNSNHDNQIIIFSCTEREKDILDYLNIKYNLITL